MVFRDSAQIPLPPGVGDREWSRWRADTSALRNQRAPSGNKGADAFSSTEICLHHKVTISYKKYFHFWSQDVQQQASVSVAETKFSMESKYILLCYYMKYCIKKTTQNNLTYKSLMIVLKEKENSTEVLLQTISSCSSSFKMWAKSWIAAHTHLRESQVWNVENKEFIQRSLGYFPPRKWWKQEESRWESSHFGRHLLLWWLVKLCKQISRIKWGSLERQLVFCRCCL